MKRAPTKSCNASTTAKCKKEMQGAWCKCRCVLTDGHEGLCDFRPAKRLTKRKMQDVDVRMSYDDVLYEKFRRLNEDLQRREERFRRTQQVAQVIQKSADNYYWKVLEIVDVHRTQEGVVVFVR